MKNRFPVKQGIVVAVTGFAVLYGVAMAAQDKPVTDGHNVRFQKLDVNRDGQLSRDEVRHIANYARALDQADGNRDGRLNQDEFIMAESIHDRAQAAAYVDDSVITAKVKGSLLKEMKSLKVSVETHRGNVLLSGFVDDEAQVKKALQVASSVDGVQSVKNGLVVVK